MNARLIVVCGLGRCGTSLVMQMLHAGGVDCIGTWPDFEDKDAFRKPLFGPTGLAAVKMLDPHLAPKFVAIPGPVDIAVVRLTRNIDEQAKSQVKFLAAMSPMHMPAPNRQSRRAFASKLAGDEAKVAQWCRRYDVLHLRFEHLLSHPLQCAVDLAQHAVGDGDFRVLFDLERATSVVVKRKAACRPDLSIERELVERGSPLRGDA